MIMIMAILDVIGVASVMPFMGVVANPDMIFTNSILNASYNYFGFVDQESYMFALGIAMFCVLLFSLAFKALTTFFQTRFALLREYTISRKLIEGYLHQPYVWFLNRNSADLGKNILTEVHFVMNNALMPMLILVAQSAVTIAILTLLVYLDPLLALTVGLILGGAYALIFKVISRFLSRIGSERMSANESRFTTTNEAFGAIKEIKAGGLEEKYLDRFSRPAEIFARHQASATVAGQLPRFALEALAFGGMIIIVLYLLSANQDLAAALPVIAFYAFAAYRLMPALQQIFQSLSQIKYAYPGLKNLYDDVCALPQRTSSAGEVKRLKLEQSIEFRDVSFRYPNATKNAIQIPELTLKARSSIGFVGSTGSGKTTTIDLILGLLHPTEGSITIDGEELSANNRRNWQLNIGYVPQQIFLADDTILANVAFGEAENEIDFERVVAAAKNACLHEFVSNELDDEYFTRVGERGVRLSGGQRQRIGIARALYHEPQLLILDEATSALDNITEQQVIDSIKSLSKELTIIHIAHRLSSVRECDQIYLLEGGRITAYGSYTELQSVSESFLHMSKLGMSL